MTAISERPRPPGGATEAARPASLRALLAIAIPVFIPLLSQNVRLLVDVAVVGRIGTADLAALSLTSYLVIILMTPLTALASAVQTSAGRAHGRADKAAVDGAARSAAVLALSFGTFFGLALWLLLSPLMALVAADGDVATAGRAYLEPIVLSAPFSGVASALYGYWLATGRTRVNLAVELAMQAVNAVAAFVLVFGLFGLPALGIGGAGLAYALSNVVGAALYVLPVRGLDLHRLASWPAFVRADRSIISTTWHAFRLNLQNALSFFALFYIVQFVGVRELAGFGTLIRLGAILVYPAQAIGRAAATLAGQAIGRGDPALAGAWAVMSGWFACLISAVLGVPLWLFAEHILMLLTNSKEVTEVATLPLRILGFTTIFSGWGILMMSILSGAGGADRARRASFLTQWIFLMPVAILAGPVLGFGLLGVWLAQSASRILLAALLWRQWIAWRKAGFAMAGAGR